jgi:ankyrin repeat protein
MYSKKAKKSLVNFVLENKGEELDGVILEMILHNPSVLLVVDEDTGISFFSALVSFGKYQLIYNAIPRLSAGFFEEEKTNKNFNIAFQMDKKGFYPLDRAYILEEGKDKEEIVERIFKTGCCYVGFGAITHFIKKDDVEGLQIIFENNEEYNLRHSNEIIIHWNEFFEKKTFLMIASEFDAINCAKFLIEKIGVKIDLQNEEGETALDIAKLMGNKKITEYLESRIKK